MSRVVNRLANMNKTTRSSVFTYALVVGAFVILQLLRMTTGLGSVLEGQLIPICAYVTMALALNLVVGVSGELSLGHAGFMSIGAFLGCAAANGLAELIPFTPVRLGVAMVIGAALAGFFGFLIGIPVLRLNGDYLAIVTLAFGEIIKSVLTNAAGRQHSGPLTHVVHPGDALHEGRWCERPGQCPQLLRRIKCDGPAVGPAERQQPGLVSLQVDAGRRCDARRGKAVPGTEVRKGGFQLLGTRPPAAADAQHPDAGHQMQSVPGRGEGKGKIGFGRGPCRIHPGGQSALHGKLSGKPYRLPGQQLAADMLDALRFQHRAVLVLCPLVHRKNAVGVGGRGDHRNGSAHGGQCTGQVIGTAQMTGHIIIVYSAG